MMRNFSVRFWIFFCVFLLASLLVGCDTELLEYEDEASYVLLDGQSAAAPTAAELRHALNIIEFNYPMGDVPWAYSKILDYLGVMIEPEAIQSIMYTVQQVAGMLDNAWVELAAYLPPVEFVDQILAMAITEANSPGFEPDDPTNIALAALAYSLENRGVIHPDQIDPDTPLHHGDVLILVVCMHPSSAADPGANALADIVDRVVKNNGISTAGIPALDDFVESAGSAEVTRPHQGNGGGNG